jgi:Zn ribbon nucleic-acid-binding protein
MAPSSVECLACGERRSLDSRAQTNLATGECPRCGYVGWAMPGDLSEQSRRALRERPLELRSVYSRRLRTV